MDVPKQIEGERNGAGRVLFRVRLLLRSVMRHVAVVAAGLFVLWIFVSRTDLYRETALGEALGILTFAFVCLTCLYYGLKALRWLKRKLLWRVRRRLVITYLFVGLTPIILLTLLGLLSAFGGSGQGLARIVTAQVNGTEQGTEAAARGLAESLARVPANTDDRGLQAWLDEHVALLGSSLPGARAALWRGASGEDVAAVGHSGPPQFASGLQSGESTDADTAAVNAPLPEWLRGRPTWGGLTFTKPTESRDNFAWPSMRAVVRGSVSNRPFALLLVVPVDRALVQRYREATGIDIHLFFVGQRLTINDVDKAEEKLTERAGGQIVQKDSGDIILEKIRLDQFGEPMPEGNINYPVVLSATEWAGGEKTQHLGFLFNWSLALAKKQFFGSGEAGEVWRQALWIVAIAFLVLELLALFAAAWMTRAVTGTVHRLYGAVEFIKRGDFSHRVKVRSHDQLGELATAFNDMSANIEALLKERVEHERLEREVEIAAEVQAKLFPSSVPELSTAAIAAECRAARGVAGDYYDYIEVAPGLVALALGDVSGKGVSASLVMSNLQAALRAQTTITAERLIMAERASAASAENAPGTGKLLTRVLPDREVEGAVARKMANINRQLCHSTEANRFATLFLALYEDRTRTLHYTNAGHNPPLLVRTDGTVERLTVGGMMAGAFDWAVFEEESATLRPGDLLLIYSDGISEAENEAGEEYGEDRLTRFARARRNLSPDELRGAIFEEINAWSGARERDDDQTLVIMKVIN